MILVWNKFSKVGQISVLYIAPGITAQEVIPNVTTVLKPRPKETLRETRLKKKKKDTHTHICEGGSAEFRKDQ